jgi:hypothetical protein
MTLILTCLNKYKVLGVYAPFLLVHTKIRIHKLSLSEKETGYYYSQFFVKCHVPRCRMNSISAK